MICLITTCRNRLSHLQETLPRFMAEFKTVVVDYSCPESCGDWAETQGANVCRVPGRELWNKPDAMNLGAAVAMAMRASRLLFVDADTLIEPGLADALSRLELDQIALAGPKKGIRRVNSTPETTPSLCGLLCVTVEAFQRVNGYDVIYAGWGYDDLDMRLRLLTDGEQRPVWVPPSLVHAIEHEDELRGEQGVGTLWEQHKRNRAVFLPRLNARLEHWSDDLRDALPYR